MARDIHDYTEQYQRLPFEPIQASYRRRKVLQEIERYKPRRLLEIGCGQQPLFVDLPEVICTVIEPSHAFAEHACQLAAGRKDVRVLKGFAEDYAPEPGEAGYDMVILSCLLHEVDDPQALLSGVRRWCTAQTVLHVNVPNARSLHRLLALAMGLIPSLHATSQTQRTMQQRGIYDAESLKAELARAGFVVREEGTLFVKPFTHAQMQALVDQRFMNAEMLDGLERLVDQLPDLGSELWANAGLNHG